MMNHRERIRGHRWRNVPCRAAIVALLIGLCIPTSAPAQTWKEVAVPAVWKNPPAEVAAAGGYAWFRCRFAVPQSWADRRLLLMAETADEARQYYINGRVVGQSGDFPPAFRSGLGGPERFEIPQGIVEPGREHVFAVRIFQREARTNFNVAAPVLIAGDEAIHLRGTWQMAAGDWPVEKLLTASDAPVFQQTMPADQAIATWKLLEGDRGPLPPQEALRHFHTPDDLVVDLVLSEPEVRQPLSIKFDERGRLWVLQYLQYPNPAGLKAVSRDKHLRTVWDRVPPPPPNHFLGEDKITIHWDSDGDGQWDQHRTFVSGLNLATSFEFDHDGLWVLNPPYLLFYPDRDHDDVPDGDPQVHLEGFGLEDSHSLTNNLRWGPDGWLYATQGSTVSADVRRYGSQDPPVHSMGQLVWRYHPGTRKYEIFAEGGGNAFGLEIDSAGRIYSGHNGGDTRGFHYVQGGYYQKGFGKHGDLSNPHAYGYFPPMRHHAVPRFTHAFLIYEGGLLPETYHGRLFGVAPLLSHVVMSAMERDGSTFKTRDVGLALSTDDPWFRPVDIQLGPDGAIYICDFYEQRIDHASHYQGRIHRESGRIYRLRPKNAMPQTVSLAEADTDELVQMLQSANRWQRQTALRLLRQRRDQKALPALETAFTQQQGITALAAFWALYGLLGCDESLLMKALRHASPEVRVWGIRLAGDEGHVSSQLAEELITLSASEKNVDVRSQLACTARRLPADVSLRLVAQLVRHDEDLADPHIPLLLWWAVEAHADSGREAILALLADESLWKHSIVRDYILERLMRRYASTGRRRDLVTAAQILALAPDEDAARRLIAGFEKAYEGRLLVGLPDELVQQLARYGGGSFVLKLRQGDSEALAKCMQLVVDSKTPRADRLLYLQVLGQIRHTPAIPSLLQLVASEVEPEVRIAALGALSVFPDEKIADQLLSLHDRLPPDVREAAEGTLVGRPSWANKFLDAVQSGRCQRDQVAKTTIARLELSPDDQIAQRTRSIWGDTSAVATQEQREFIHRVETILLEAAGNPYRGRQLFSEHCGKCHRLFQAGGQIGPDLTAYRRDDVQRMVANIVNPSLEIREGYENYLIVTTDGRTLNGFLADQDSQTVTLRSAEGQTVTVTREEIEDMYVVPKSIMPEGLLKDWPEQDIRDLFAYLRASQPLPE